MALLAEPVFGNVLDDWGISGCGNTAPWCTFTMTADRMAVVKFAPCPVSRCIAFDRYPDGFAVQAPLILQGNEFASAGVVLSAAPEGSYCVGSVAAVIPRFTHTYDNQFVALTTSDPADIALCNSVPVTITFTARPALEVQLQFSGASVSYDLRAYDAGGDEIALASQEAAFQGGIFTITVNAGGRPISWVKMGHQSAVTLVKEIRVTDWFG